MIVGDCAVCMAGMASESAISACPCGHIFHQTCLDEWLRHNRRRPICPTCRAEVARSSIVKKLYFAIPNITLTDDNRDLMAAYDFITAEARALRSALATVQKKYNKSLRMFLFVFVGLIAVLWFQEQRRKHDIDKAYQCQKKWFCV